MKKLLLLCLILNTFLCYNLIGQSKIRKNNITLTPFGLVNKIRVKYERTLPERFGIGSIFSSYYGLFPGWKVEPFLRWYMGAQAPAGLYMQGKATFGVFSPKFDYSVNIGGYTILKTIKQEFGTGGLGLAIGYQWIHGKKNNIVIDLFIGFQGLSFDIPKSYTENGVRYDSDFNAGIWYGTGPGSLFNGTTAIGIAF